MCGQIYTYINTHKYIHTIHPYIIHIHIYIHTYLSAYAYIQM